MSSLLEIICAAEATGELQEPAQKHRRYWVHPLHSSKEYNMKFQIFYDNLKKYPASFLTTIACPFNRFFLISKRYA